MTATPAIWRPASSMSANVGGVKGEVMAAA
jgi:hypothetical protein